MQTKDKLLLKLNVIETMLHEQFMLSKETLTLEDVCKYLNLSQSYVYKLTSARQIPHFKPTGKRLYFDRSEIVKWLKSKRVLTLQEIEDEAATRVTLKP